MIHEKIARHLMGNTAKDYGYFCTLSDQTQAQLNSTILDFLLIFIH